MLSDSVIATKTELNDGESHCAFSKDSRNHGMRQEKYVHGRRWTDTLTVPSLGSVNNSLNTGHRRHRASQYGMPSFHHLCSEYGANTVPSLIVIFLVYVCLATCH